MYACCDNGRQAYYLKDPGPQITSSYVSTSYIGVISIQMVLVNEISSNSCYGTNRRSDYVCMDTPAWFTDSSKRRLKTRHDCLCNGVIIARVCLSLYREPLDARPYERDRKREKERNTKWGKERGGKSLDLSEQWKNERRH